MAATTGYQAGAETNDVLLSYGTEATWGTAPAAQFQAIRITSESLAGQKARSRPPELNPSGGVQQAVTNQESAGGNINFALSYGTFDGLFEIVLANDWQALQAINGASGDITITNVSATVATLSSTTSNKFSTLGVGQWIRTLGFTNAANNGFHYVSAKANNQTLTLTTLAAAVNETPTGTNAKVRASTIVNGALFKSVSLQKKLNTSQYLRYPGLYVTGLQIGGSVGGFMSGSFTTMAQSESKATADWSTGAVLAAPTGAVHDTVAAFGGVFINETALSAALNSISLNVNRTGADMQHGMGSAAGQGMTRGLIEVTGTLELYFRSFTEYDLFKAETNVRLAMITKDATGQAYVISLPAAALMNPQVQAGGASQPVLARFSIEGNPDASGTHIRFDRLAAA